MENFETARELLASLDQEHVLAFYDRLSGAEQAGLLNQVLSLDFSCLRTLKNENPAEGRGVITPLTAMQLPEIEARRDEFVAAGTRSIKNGEIAAVLLAGGMGTRLGSSDPKGMYDIGVTRPVFIFERLVSNLLAVVKETGTWIRLLVMTSEKNDEATRSFFKEHDFFGYNPECVTFFMQDAAPCTDFDGKILLEAPDRIATSPNGNGGWFATMLRLGIVDELKKAGVKWLNVFAVDNVLQKIADPAFIGAVLLSGCASGSKVVRKANRDEKTGVMCLEDGRPSVIEYTEMTDELLDAKDENGEPAYNFGVILNYLFNMEELIRVANEDLSYHIARKKIPHIDESGNRIAPEEPNGIKFELFILDLVKKLPGCLPYEVVREKEFAPIKNKTGVDSVDSARELCRLNGIEL